MSSILDAAALSAPLETLAAYRRAADPDVTLGDRFFPDNPPALPPGVVKSFRVSAYSVVIHRDEDGTFSFVVQAVDGAGEPIRSTGHDDAMLAESWARKAAIQLHISTFLTIPRH